MRSYIYALTKATEYGMLDLVEKSEENQLTPKEFDNRTRLIQEDARKIAEIYHIFCCSPDHVLITEYDSLIRSKDYILTPHAEDLFLRVVTSPGSELTATARRLIDQQFLPEMHENTKGMFIVNKTDQFDPFKEYKLTPQEEVQLSRLLNLNTNDSSENSTYDWEKSKCADEHAFKVLDKMKPNLDDSILIASAMDLVKKYSGYYLTKMENGLSIITRLDIVEVSKDRDKMKVIIQTSYAKNNLMSYSYTYEHEFADAIRSKFGEKIISIQ